MSHELPFPARDAGRADSLSPPFACSYRNGGLDAAWVHVGGELDIATTPQLARTLDEAQARLVVLDLRDLAFIDCSGIHAIIDAGIRARGAGRRLVLARVPSSVDRVLALTECSDQVEMADKTPRNVEPAC